jgi:Holliday junction resolvase-like predicted endonuclease
MKTFTSPTQKIGELGEDIACRWLEKKEYKVTDRNYTKKWGEIDIVAEKEGITHFIEVKSSKRVLQRKKESVTHETQKSHNNYNPAENMHPWKIKRFVRAVETYLLSSKGQKINNSVGGWQIDLLVVYLDLDKKFARCEIFERVI